jgi:threonine-phosphate decarboxylase
LITGHGGDIFEAARLCGCEPDDILDMSSNMNPLGAPAEMLEHLRRNLNVLTRLPEADARRAAAALARLCDLEPESLIVGSGTTQFIYTAPAVLNIQRALIPIPTYADYADACRMGGIAFQERRLPEDGGFAFAADAWAPVIERCDTVYFCNPNNPTGRLTPAAVLEALCRNHPQTRFIIDESYLPLCPGGVHESMLHRPPANRIVLRSLSKMYCLPGLRIGFLVGDPSVVKRFYAHLPPWSVNSLAQCAIAYLLEHRKELQSFVKQSLQHLAYEKALFCRELQRRTAIVAVPSETVFVLARLPQSWTAPALKSRLLSDRILIRDCTNFQGLDHRYVRFSLKDRNANRRLLERLAECCPPSKGTEST